MPERPSGDYPSSHAEPPSPDISPLSLILEIMRERYVAKDYDGAIALAKIAAPYLHPRVPSATPPSDLATMPDADLEQLSPRD